jgi:serine protease inhibitor
MKTSVYLMMLTAAVTFGVEEKKAAPDSHDAVSKITQGNTACAMDLYQQLRQEEENLFFSPLPASARALAMDVWRSGGRVAKLRSRWLRPATLTRMITRYHTNITGRMIEQFNEQGEKEDYHTGWWPTHCGCRRSLGFWSRTWT